MILFIPRDTCPDKVRAIKDEVQRDFEKIHRDSVATVQKNGKERTPEEIRWENEGGQ